jgi:hypothetical protein
MHWFPKSSSKSRLLLAAQENGPIRSAFVVVLDRVLPAECSDGGVGVPWRLGSSEQRRPARSPPAGDEEQCQGHREREREGSATNRFCGSQGSGAHRIRPAAVMSSPADGSVVWGGSGGVRGMDTSPDASPCRGTTHAPAHGDGKRSEECYRRRVEEKGKTGGRDAHRGEGEGGGVSRAAGVGSGEQGRSAGRR